MDENEKRRSDYEPDLYKKFFKTKTQAGFVALRQWFDAGKLSVDIGEVTVGGGLSSNTLVWAPAIGLTAYLRSAAQGTVDLSWPAMGTTPAGTYTYYGGSQTPEGPRSRILKIEHWDPQDASKGYRWKTGHFQARMSSTGAFIPDMQQSVSQNMIKVTNQEMTEVDYCLELAISRYTLTHEDWLAHLHGKDRR